MQRDTRGFVTHRPRRREIPRVYLALGAVIFITTVVMVAIGTGLLR